MTIEQLLCPAVMDWSSSFEKMLEENHIEMSQEEIEKEFDKWLVENEELVNKSVEDNMDLITEALEKGKETVNESIFNDDDFADDGVDKSARGIIDAEDTPKDDDTITGEIEGVENEENDGEPKKKTTTITGAIKMSNKKKDDNYIYNYIQGFWERVQKRGENRLHHRAILGKLDVSGITDMTALFAFTDLPKIDLSSWDTGKVAHMEGMFYKSTFNNESICGWDVSSCADFKNMFAFCPFNKSLNLWTPAYIEVTDPDTGETVMKRHPGPIIGGNAEEEKELFKQMLNKKFDEMEAGYDGDDEDINENKNIDMKKTNNLHHVMDYDTFVNEGKVKDFINKGIEKVKDVFKTITLKCNQIVAFFKDSGEMLPVTSPYTSMNVIASGKVPGVKAYCKVSNEYLDPAVNVEPELVHSAEYYGIIDKNSLEYKNYETFAGMIKEHYEKYGDTGAFELNEGFGDEVGASGYKRVGFSASEGGVVARDIKTNDLKEILEDLIKNVPAYKGKRFGGAVFIWGAPGIGKSTIPNAIVKTWNKDPKNVGKKALLTVQCGDLTIDGFSLPIPADKSVAEYLDERPALNKLIKKSDIEDGDLERIKRGMHTVSEEAIKTWLPAYKTVANSSDLNVLNAIANGHLEIKENEDGTVSTIETTEGGILLFDEFFRAEPNIFKILMQLILNREYSGYKLGNKWGILCCSNRPNDDEEVEKGFSRTGAVVGNRLLAGAYNFIPSFKEWKKWAVSEGGFDDITIEFLMSDVDDETKEYTYWHTIRPEEYTATGNTIWPTPRSWSALMVELHNYAENHGYADILDIPEDKIHLKADGIIGLETANKYVDYIKAHIKEKLDVDKILKDPKYAIPTTLKVSTVFKKIERYIMVKYSDENLPSPEEMMNLFNKINSTYDSTMDNLAKKLHIEIWKCFNIMGNRDNRIALKDYVKAVDGRYSLEEKDLV